MNICDSLMSRQALFRFPPHPINACRPLPTLRTPPETTNSAERQSRPSQTYLLSDISYPSQGSTVIIHGGWRTP